MFTLGLYQDSSRGWFNLDGAEIIFDLKAPLVPQTWNTFCFTYWQNATYQIAVNGEVIRQDKFQEEVRVFSLVSPLIVGAGENTDDNKLRFFGELTNFNIWSEIRTKTNVLDWSSTEIDIGDFQDHIEVLDEVKLNDLNVTEKILIQSHIQDFESGFQDCEKLGGSPVYTFNMNELYQWDRKNLCNYFWFPVKYRYEMWSERDSYRIVEEVLPWGNGHPSNEIKRPCMYVKKIDKFIGNDDCSVPYCHICSIAPPLRFKLTGLCKDSTIDSDYFLNFSPSNEHIEFNGLGSTDIIRNEESGTWEIVDVLNSKIVRAKVDGGSLSNRQYPVGTLSWSLLNDSCSSSTKKLKFSRCNQVYIFHITVLYLMK